MRVGIDIDDTTVITVNSMIKYADLYDTKILGRNGTNGNLGLIKDRYYLKVLYGWDDQTKFDFFHKYYRNVLEECELMPDCVSVINDLKNKGHEIYFITARLLNIDNCDTEKITIDTLKDINYDKLIIQASDKLKYCKELGIDLFIEDSYETCKELKENNIKSLLMTTKMNESIQDSSIERVNNWLEIAQKIEKM